MANSRRSKRELARLPGESQAEAQARSIRDQGEAHESQILEKDIEKHSGVTHDADPKPATLDFKHTQ